MYVKQLAIEATVVGLSVTLVGFIVSFLMALIQDRDFRFLRNPEMYLALLLTGVILHVVWDIAGINRMYCESSYASKYM